MTNANPRTPSDLAVSGPGRKFFRDVVGLYDLDPHEIRVLHEAAHTLDECERVRQTLAAAESLVAKGSMGQAVEHPLLGTLRAHRATFDKLIGRLALPDSEGNAPLTAGQKRSQQANGARWAERRAEKAEQARRGA